MFNCSASLSVDMRGDNERIYIVVCPLFNTPVLFFAEILGDRTDHYCMLITVVPFFVTESEF